MKIYKTIILVMLAFLSYTNVQAQNIPNGSFEHWTISNGIPALNQWTITAGQPSDTLSPSPSLASFDSVYSLQLKTKYVLGAGVVSSLAATRYPISQNPNYLQGYYKSKRTGIGSAVIKVNVYNNNIKIGVGTLHISDTVGTFSPFEVFITYSQTLIADEAEIVFLSDDNMNYALNNTLWVDKISFSALPLSTNENLHTFENISIYPNPVKDILNVEVVNKNSIEIKILNSFGQEILRNPIHAGINSINIDFLAAGMYWLETSTNGKRTISKFVKE